jgi:hypothetical protein
MVSIRGAIRVISPRVFLMYPLNQIREGAAFLKGPDVSTRSRVQLKSSPWTMFPWSACSRKGSLVL